MLDTVTTMSAAIRRHVEAKFAQAAIESSPFPHIIIEDFFPDDVYRDIIRLNPFKQNAGREYLPKSQVTNVTDRTPSHFRKQINFDADDDFQASEEGRRFWTELKDCFLGSQWFEAMVLDKFPEYFALRFGDLVHEPDFLGLLSKRLFLQRHEPGFVMGPHTDIPIRIFTCIFSFADRPGFEEYGTAMLAHQDRLVRCWGIDHYPMDGFEVRKIAPYKPNNLLLFFKTRHSFHAVPPITDEVPNQRYGMQFQLWEPWDGLLKDLSAPDLMRVTHLGRGQNRLKRAVKVMLGRD
jgi:hypothetical protein